MDDHQNWLRFPYDFIFARSHYLCAATVEAHGAARAQAAAGRGLCRAAAGPLATEAGGVGDTHPGAPARPARTPGGAPLRSALMMRRARHLLATAPQ
jgi:hypothetical protein